MGLYAVFWPLSSVGVFLLVIYLFSCAGSGASWGIFHCGTRLSSCGMLAQELWHEAPGHVELQ